MANDREDPLFPDEQKSMLQKLLPPLILIAAFGGFVSLAIYAYKAGTQSESEENLVVVEAEKTPTKEKPEDPGGMQFPNQDKTIFETFAANGGKAPANVERVLPTPEEPMPKDLDTSGTTTWVNDKLTTPTPAAPDAVEQVFNDDTTASAPSELPTSATPEDTANAVKLQEDINKQRIAEPVSSPTATQKLPSKMVEMTQPLPSESASSPSIVEPKEVILDVPKKDSVSPVAAKAIAEKPATKKATTGKQLVQLGAYKDEPAARADFVKLQKKYSALAGKTPTVNRADLGDKGIFYRLRVATDDGKKLCASLSSQACMVVK